MKYLITLFIPLLLFFSCTNQEEKGMSHEHDVTTYYTCSMHPQIMETKPGKCPICFMDLTPISSEQLQGNTIKLSTEQIALANIQTNVIGFDNIENQIYATGVVKENERSIQYVNARLDGRVEKLFIKTTGVSVMKGQILYEMYSEMLTATQSEFITNWKLLEQNPNDELLKRIYQNAQTKLSLWGLTNHQIEQLKVRSKPLIPYPIVSTASGVIKKINISEGGTVMEGDNIFELVDYTTLWIDAEFYANEMNTHDAIGKIVQLQFDGKAKGKSSGRIIEILPQVSPSSTVTVVRIAFENPSSNIQPGMQANIIFQKESSKAILVPSNAVLNGANENTVWIKNTDGSYESKMVQVGATNSNSTEVLHGLKAGDEVVVSGAYLLQSEFIFKKGVNPMAGHDMSKM
ncbi:efflux RND transporter periplasmic adaptor subunit [Cytophaga aurantiaca]|uniref:efflux RND transporter periplasmic adaptor subunit n=1 Tax=Cytophaga aurantiaca TaxID=29530 RepID=UPI0009FC71BA|nr:efflux RND transporter periplasmic adaptor subunit [Cytophaga aurantiaca]